jgi:hypothetical protein
MHKQQGMYRECDLVCPRAQVYDEANNKERVTIERPQGTISVRVRGTSIKYGGGSQKFAYVASGAMREVACASTVRLTPTPCSAVHIVHVYTPHS